MNEEDFYEILESISMAGAEKMRDEKITPDLVNLMSDEELTNYLPLHGDRLRLRSHLQKQQKPQNRKNTLLKTLQQKLDQASGTRRDTGSKTTTIEEEMRNPNRPFGNRHAAKPKRQIELGWIHKTHLRSTQVRKKKGGGTRKSEVPKTARKRDIMNEAISLFFPNDVSTKGPKNNFEFDLWDFSDRPIDENMTVSEMYETTKMPILRFYLATAIKDNDVVASSSQTSVSEDRGHKDTQNDLLSQAIEIAEIPLGEEEDFLPDPASSDEATEVPLRAKEVSIKLHRGHLLRELISAFVDIDPIKDIISVQMIMPDGKYEAAEDGGGVTRDALADFWITFYDQCTLGTKFKVPFLRHDFGETQWESVAKIIIFGWKSCGYFPIQLSLPFLQMCLFEKVTSPILDAFFGVIPEDEAITLKKVISDFNSVDQDDLLDVLDLHESKNRPTADNITKLLEEIAHKELVQTPMFIIDCFKPYLEQLQMTENQLNQLYCDLVPTPRHVIKILKFPEKMVAEEQTTANHLKRFVRELNSESLGKFLHFCTGSDLLVGKEITVSFVNVTGLGRRPVSHTCSCLLELSKFYDSFPEFRSEFMAVLSSNVWVMDII